MILKSSGIFSDEAIERIFTLRYANPGMKFAEAVVKFGGVKEKDFLEAVGKVLSLETVDLSVNTPSPEALTKLPASAINQYNVLPYRFDGESLTVVSSDPFDTAAVDGLRLVAGCRVTSLLATRAYRLSSPRPYAPRSRILTNGCADLNSGMRL